IVVLENITTHIERGSRPKQAAVYATNEVAISVIASTLTMLAVFLPLTMIQGMAGILFRQLGWIVSIIMIVSTVAALTLIPMACSRMLKQSTPSSKFYEAVFGRIFRWLDSLDTNYGKLLGWCVHHRKTVIAMAFTLFVAVLLIAGPVLKTEFFPAQDNARISINIELPIGTAQNITRDLSLELSNKLIKKYPEIMNCSFTEGSANSDNVWATMQDNGTHIISFNIRLLSVEERERGLTAICNEMRNDLLEYPQIKTFKVIAGGQQGGMGGESTVDVEIYGYDFAASDATAANVVSKFKEIPGLTQVTVSRSEYTPEYQVDFDREKVAINGLNVGTASMYLRNRINGSLASYYREDGDEYEIRVRYAPEFRRSVEDIDNIIVYNAQGKGIRIRDMGKVIETLTPPTIERKDRERVVTVSAVVPKGMAMSDLVAATNSMMADVDMPAGLSWQIGGMYEDQQDTFSDLLTLMILIIILVFIVMAAQFESLTYPFVIMFSIPFALTGVLI
ncbi:MAG: efflux RND transporter permease subunit, partial [Bacteroidales bacterium]